MDTTNAEPSSIAIIFLLQHSQNRDMDEPNNKTQTNMLAIIQQPQPIALTGVFPILAIKEDLRDMSLKQKVLVLLAIGMAAVFALFITNGYFPVRKESPVSLGFLIMLAAETALLGWGVFIMATTFKPISSTMQDLIAVGKGIEESSTKAHDTSLALADGAANEAASLEETSASLEEITSMTSQNAKNADQGQLLMKELHGFVDLADKSMARIQLAMGEIHESNSKIQKIIKNIDEISFQTNLLALNAAVEAARAGEHGAGFAVVSGEVRNLSLRAAQAAKESQELIKDALLKVQAGADLVTQTESNFSSILQTSAREIILVDEIAQGSKEQATALDQISKALNQIDLVTQASSTQASESARVSEHMEYSTHKLRQVISVMGSILEGRDERRDVVKLVKKASATVKRKGLHQTLAMIQNKNGPFKIGKDVYVYAGSLDVVTLLAHPVMPEKLVGPDLANWPDKRGKTFFNDLVAVAKTKGEGWVDYWWPKPGETAPSLKSTYVLRVPGEKVYFACGIYS
jgi:methyl-accepting chemotaxis protein